jgi:uncharacterized protein
VSSYAGLVNEPAGFARFPAPLGTAAVTLAVADGAELARRAAGAVAARLTGRSFDGRPPVTPALRVLGATFVTLESAGRLLGCIGSIEPGRPLYLDAMHNAVRAAADPRLPAVTAAQWTTVDVKVSVLSLPEHVRVQGRGELVDMLRPGVDGLVLADSQRRATFLPAVWRKVPDAGRFLTALLDKGGWSHADHGASGWPVGITVQRYTTIEFIDPGPR